MNESAGRTDSKLPLCVDLDGTLIKTDTLVEAIFLLCKLNVFYIFLFPFWLLRGRAFFKFQIFSRVNLDVEYLPYNQEFLDFLRSEYRSGRKLVLATGSSQKVAELIARYLGIFSVVVASDDRTNVSGRRKAEILCELFGVKQFAYAGNETADLKVWQVAAEGYVVSPSVGVETLAARQCPIVQVFRRKRAYIKLLLRAIRVHQWAKNVLIFAPLVLAHRMTEISLIMLGLHAFLAFSLVSSSVYLLNDLLDLDSDRRHPDNRRRPFASGDLPMVWGVFLIPVLLITGGVLSLDLSVNFFLIVAAYYVVTLAYSVHLKQVVLADILILASLYAWRTVAGAVAVQVPLSIWFIAFAGFFFFSLALVKRCSELVLMGKNQQAGNPRRGYTVSDLPQLQAFGASSGYISVLVLALYIDLSDQVKNLYKHPMILLIVCPFLLYWLSRVWLKAHRGKMSSDPLVFALKDKVSYIMILAMALIWLAAKTNLL